MKRYERHVHALTSLLDPTTHRFSTSFFDQGPILKKNILKIEKKKLKNICVLSFSLSVLIKTQFTRHLEGLVVVSIVMSTNSYCVIPITHL
jgi:hypothetical protein